MGWLSAIGGALGSFFGPVGTAVGTFAGGFLDSEFSDSGGDASPSPYSGSSELEAGDVMTGNTELSGGDFSGGNFSSDEFSSPVNQSSASGQASGWSSSDVRGLVGDVFKGVAPFAPSLAQGASAYGIYEAQQIANEKNIQLSQENNAFNAQQAAIQREWSAQQADLNRGFQQSSVDKQMGFQQAMSSSAYQRAVQDMKAAGLNPMLAVSQGGASSPGGGAAGGSAASGSAASSGGLARVENVLSTALGTSAQVARVSQELENMRAGKDRTEAETDFIRENTKKVQQETITSSTSASRNVQEVENLREQMDRIRAEVKQIDWQTLRTKEEAVARRVYVNSIQPLERRALEISNQLSAYDLPEARASAHAWETTYGETIRPFLKDVFGVARGAGNVGLRFPSRSISTGTYTRGRP